MNGAEAMPLEPSRERLAGSPLRWFLATRPAFLSITLMGGLLGLAGAYHDGLALAWPLILASVVLALLAHAAVNVLNDYCDHRNGTDAANTERLYPYTGGSRFIQNGVLTPRETLVLAIALATVVVIGGVVLAWQVGPGLIGIGLVGLVLGWAYSAPPLRLNSRGLGEPTVAAGFALIVVGADYVLRGEMTATPWRLAVPYALLVANILYINQFPDWRADAGAGKRHWVVRLGPRRAVWGYVLFLSLAAAWLLGLVAGGVVPRPALIALLALWPGVRAGRSLFRHAENPAALRPAIRLTLAAAHAFPVLLAAILILERTA